MPDDSRSAATKKLQIDVWSDIACPWCYIGKRHLEAALADFPHRDQVEIVWRAFELNPAAPALEPSSGGSYAARLAKKYGFSIADAEKRLDSMTVTAAKDGLDFRFDRIKPGNTFDAHRVVHLALERGKQGAVKERLLRAYMTEGVAMSDHEALIRLGSEAGLDADEVRAVLASDTYANDVRGDEREAHQIGISGVPFFLIGRYGVSGAQPADELRKVLEKAWNETPELVTSELPEGASCGVDGCV
ncbi:MAG: DsbA family oxidoreductase [Polyangiaceae bacterium]